MRADLCLSVVQRVFERHPSIVKQLAFATDSFGRVALNITHGIVRDYIQSRIFFCGRYELQAGAPIHRSATAVVMHALDHGVHRYYERAFSEAYRGSGVGGMKLDAGGFRRALALLAKLGLRGHLDLDEDEEQQEASEAVASASSASASSQMRSRRLLDAFSACDTNKDGAITQGEFSSYCTSVLGRSVKVVVKFMRHADQCERERTIRGGGGADYELDPRFVLGLLPGLEGVEGRFAEDVKTSYFHATERLGEFPYGLIMPAADKSMDSIYRSERPDEVHIMSMMRDVALALKHCHDNEIVHGDVKMLNILRVNNKILLIDMDAACDIQKGQLAGAKFSSGALPPEMFYVFSDASELAAIQNYWSRESEMAEREERGEVPLDLAQRGLQRVGAALWGKVAPRKVASVAQKTGRGAPKQHLQYVAVKTFRSQEETTGLPYSTCLVKATPQLDLWAFGCVLFTLVAGTPLLTCGVDDDITSDEDVLRAATWTSAPSGPSSISRAIDSKVGGAPAAAHLLKMVLQPDPSRRPPTMQEVLDHPYFQLGSIGGGDGGEGGGGQGDNKAILLKLEAMEAQQRQQTSALKRIEAQQQAILTKTAEVQALATKTLAQVKATERVMLKALIEANDVTVPSCFIVVNQLLEHTDEWAAVDHPQHRNPEELGRGAIKSATTTTEGDSSPDVDGCSPALTADEQKKADKSQRWLSWLAESGRKVSARVADKMAGVTKAAADAAELVGDPAKALDDAVNDSLYLYLVDGASTLLFSLSSSSPLSSPSLFIFPPSSLEFTFKPVIPPAGSKSPYPLRITQPKDFVRRYMPLMKVGLKAMLLFNGVAGLAQCLGYPVPKVPSSITDAAAEAVGRLDQASSVAEFDVLQAAVSSSSGSGSGSGAEDGKAVRGQQLRDLARYLSEHDPHCEFSGLQRVVADDGACLWAAPDHVETMRTEAQREQELIEAGEWTAQAAVGDSERVHTLELQLRDSEARIEALSRRLALYSERFEGKD